MTASVKRPMPRRNTPVAPDTEDLDIREFERREEERIARAVVPDEAEGSKPVVDEDTGSPGERAPNITAPSPVDRLRSLAARAKKPAKKAAGTRTAKPRVPVDKVIGWGWGILGRVFTAANPSVGRVLAMQSPVAGMILEDTVKNTVADRILQPIARTAAGGEIAIALLGPPLLVGAITSKPEMASVLVPMLRESLRTWIDIAGPKLEEVAKQEKEFEDHYGERIDAMIEWILQPAAEKIQRMNEETSVPGEFSAG